jgi:CubicO group peptidase (beta-lactamase class C family)
MLLFERYTGRPGSLRLLVVAMGILAVSFATGSSALAQSQPDSPSPTPLAGRGPTDEREVEAFLDGFFAQQLESYKIPGATVSVVSDGEVLFAKGYGQADVAKEEPVVADETLFRIASTSKLFTATAVMQLVEEGKLDLDEDVNAYLDDVEVPDTYPGRPVTLRHLLTHTAGFEEAFTGSGARDATEVEPLGEYLSGKTPARVRPPGEAMAYSNYGMSLAGHVVEEVSGVPFERYVEENVTDPLGMERTTFDQPPPLELRERLATGYERPRGPEPVAGPFEYIDDAPAGSASTTATDMAAFMIAHLQDGRYGDPRILEEATAKEMHERQFAAHPRLDGMAYGFMEGTMNGERVLEHGGNLFRFHALAALLPEHDVGIFVAYNSYGEDGDFAEYELVKAFMDRYYPEAAPPPAPEPLAQGPPGSAERVAGSYRSTRSNQSGFEKVFTLLGGARVTANGDGSITTTGVPIQEDFTGPEQRWVEVEPLLFRAEGSDEHVAFEEDGRGRITYLTGEVGGPTSVSEKVPFYGARRLHLGLLAGTFAMFVLTVLGWPAGALISRWYGRRDRKLHGNPNGVRPGVKKPGREVGAARLARPLAWAVCALALLFAAGMALMFSNPEGTLFYGDLPLLVTVLTLPFPVAALTAGVLVYAALAWTRRYWGFFGRLHYALVALSALTFVALLGYYNLLGFQF